MIWVRNGSSAAPLCGLSSAISLKTPTNTGTMKVTTASMIMIATLKMKAG